MVVAIIAPGKLPIPCSRGGAIETLTTQVIDENETHEDFRLHVFSYYDEDAFKQAEKYKNTVFHFYKSSVWGKFSEFCWRIIYKLSFRRIPFRSPLIDSKKKEMIKLKPDVILVEGNFLQVLQLNQHSKLALHIHTDKLNKEEYLARKVIKRCDKIAVISNYIKRRVDEVYPEEEKTFVIKNSIDTELFRRDISNSSYLKKELKIEESKGIVIYCGRVTEIKGVLELIKAFEIAHLDNTILLIVGGSGFSGEPESDYEKSVHRYAQERKLNVVFTGYVNHSKLPAYYSIADYSVCPSICNEAAGLVIIEALCCGIPVIAADRGGIPEYTDSDCTILVKYDESFISNLADAMKEMDNDLFRKRLAENARMHGEQYNLSEYYRRFSEFLGVIVE